VVGECFVYGMMDGETLLGPFPSPWSVHVQQDLRGLNQPMYWNSETKSYQQDDPRLGELPACWEKVEREKTSDDPHLFSPHRNKLTGEVINSDPRVFPEALKERGVDLQMFRLV